MRIFPKKVSTFETKKKFVQKNLEEIFMNLMQTLTNEGRVLNPKACGVQGCSPGRCGGKGLHRKKNIAKWINSWKFFFFKISKVFKFTWKMQIVLKRLNFNFRISWFLISEIWSFLYSKCDDFEYKIDLNSKTKKSPKSENQFFIRFNSLRIITHCAR